jgi:alpha-amylase
MKLRIVFTLLCLSLWLLNSASLLANPWNGQVVLQGFWWDYWNNNYPNNWSTYLAKLAPRLKNLGIDTVWIPPTSKCNSGTSSVGYDLFDHYDLGDKFQKGTTTTRFGTKDEYLRCVAVLHANGIKVMQDIIWNHQMGAEWQDFNATDDNKWKEFRYVCYATTVSVNYGSRQGRFWKNGQNFHRSAAHNNNWEETTQAIFGEDICFWDGSYGQSSSTTDYDPLQTSQYMRNGMRNWSVWLKKQTGVDGFRLDTAKHVETFAVKDFTWNLAYGAGWASGGAQMLFVGEVACGDVAKLDGWVDAVNNDNGFVDLVGTFDFSLRGALRDVIDGSYDLSWVPGAQQNRRNRTMPFVNNHDTFRPILDASGNYTSSWDTANELCKPHVDPRDARAPAAYAIAMAVDGSPQIFFEDLFDVGTTGKRWTHQPTSTTDLPTREYLVNLIWCHQKMNWKDGAYKIRHSAPDLLIIERSAKAIIGVNDHWSSWQSATVQTDFGPNVQLHDYSGANSSDIWTDGSGRATIWVPPAINSGRKCYTVWGPTGISGGFSPAAITTTQEWEMADDLGDSHASSLQQGGAIPANSTVWRTAGKIFPAGGTTITVNVYPANTSPTLVTQILNASNSVVKSVTGAGNQTITHTAASTQYHTIRIRNNSSSNPGQKAWIKVTYSGPQSF